MAGVASGPDATDKPANIHTIPAMIVARILLPALIVLTPCDRRFKHCCS
jgi:hypothetical protein